MKKEITDKKILELLKKKEVLANENLSILTEMEKLETRVNSNAAKIKMLDERVRPLILREVSKIVIGEYDELVRVFNDKGKWTMEFINRLEEFKKNWSNRNKQIDKKDEIITRS